MDYTELSLGPSALVLAKRTNSSLSESEESPSSRKRKYQQNNFKINTEESSIVTTTHDELQLMKDTYFSDCHDLQFERMYYLNKNTMMIKKNSTNWPKHQKLDLELNISSNIISSDEGRSSSESMLEDLRKQSSSSSNMVAMGCSKCNLLVMLSKSFPSCPNCKFVNSIPTDRLQSLPRQKIAKSLDTLSLLN